ncbi:MAG: hypothetical protein LBI31_05940, partial [Zoogloeaceae bacterium]|nr:hypothetical protein [Zoogloeaceae bacterium]
MKKFFVFLLCFLCSGCLPQGYRFEIFLENTCSNPIQIEAFPVSNLPDPEGLGRDRLDRQNMEVGDNLTVFFGISGHEEDIQHIIPDNYQLEISANG